MSPYFIVDGAQKFIDFLKNLFRATELRRYDGDRGILHAEIRIDDSVVMLADSTEAYPANKHLIHVYVPNVDEVYKKALALGCTPIQEPRTQDGDPDKRGMFLDFAGNTWAIGTQIAQSH